jgi:hypothetical protein
VKKQKLNNCLYESHLHNAHVWDKIWSLIETDINEKLEKIMSKKYKTHERKLKSLRAKREIRLPNESTTEHNQSDTPLHKFFPKVVNHTNMDFTKEKITLLSKGLQYNLHNKNKSWFKYLAIEADTAICMADAQDQDFLKRTIETQLRNIARKSKEARYDKQMFINEKKILQNLKAKLELNYACVTSADKGKTVIVISKYDYSDKISQFINDNKFDSSNTDPTVAFQKQSNQAIQSSTIIKNEHKWKLKSINPTSPVIKGLVKLHEENNSIRPVINMRTSPSYKLASFVSKQLSTLLQLPFSFNVKNSPQLIQDLSKLKFEPQFRMCSFDISNMYTNIPTETISDIIQGIIYASSANTDHIKHINSLMNMILN